MLVSILFSTYGLLIRRRKKRSQERVVNKQWRVIGATMGLDGKAALCFTGRHLLSREYEMKYYADYYIKGEWPHDPRTGHELRIIEGNINYGIDIADIVRWDDNGRLPIFRSEK